jgi:hypothetical protein
MKSVICSIQDGAFKYTFETNSVSDMISLLAKFGNTTGH